MPMMQKKATMPITISVVFWCIRLMRATLSRNLPQKLLIPQVLEDSLRGSGMSVKTAGKKVKSMTTILKMPKHANTANSVIAAIRLTSRDPRPMAVVKAARTVGKAIFENVKKAARDGVFSLPARCKYSELICRQ